MPHYGEKTLKRILTAFKTGKVDELDQHDASIVEQISFADDQVRRVGPSNAAKIVKEKFNLSSLRQAYYVVDAAQQCFGSTMMTHKAYWRGFAIDKLVIGVNHITRLLEEKMKRDEHGQIIIDEDGNPVMEQSEVGPWELGALARLMKELRETVGYSKEDDIAEKWEEARQKIIMFTGDVRHIGIEPLKKSEREKLLNEYLGDDNAS